MKKVKINGRMYDIKELGFEDMILLEDEGVDLMSGDLTFRNVVTILGYMVGLETLECAKELTQHVKGGGTLEEVMEVINVAMEDSGFTEGKANPQKATKR